MSAATDDLAPLRVGQDDLFGTARLRDLVAVEVRACMARKGVTGEELAYELGASGTYVSRRLRGKTAFDMDDLQAIAAVLGVALTTLVAPALDELDRRREWSPAGAEPGDTMLTTVRRPAPNLATARRRRANAEKPSCYSKPGQSVVVPLSTAMNGHPFERRPAA